MSPTQAYARRDRRSRTTTRPGPARARRAAAAVVIRPATPDDAAVVTDLRVALLHEDAPHRPRHHTSTLARLEARARALTVSQLAAAHRSPRREVLFVAEQHARPVGLLRCVVARSASLARPGRYALVTTVFVRPSLRRRGVLRRLLHAADTWARTHRLRELRLHCAVGNHVGNAAWTALGFAPVDILYRRAIPAEPSSP